jgi:acyl-CoA synthetase (AMP-forming)/AMP-acid ligase II
VSFAAGSPAIWSKVADYCLEHKIKLPALKYLVMFGAPVPVSLHRKYKKILTVGTTYTPYGATESLPVSNISGEYILDFTANHSEKGMGTCVGIAAPEIEIKILKTKDGELKIFSSDDECGQGDIGEIIVSGRVVTKKYDGLEEETAKAKTYDENGVLWHRMGDMGYLDGQNRLWFCGRKSHVVKWQGKDLYSIPTEAVFNKHPLVDRSALIATDDGPAVVFEKNKKLFKVNEKLQSELKKIADSASHTKSIDKFFVIDEFPVDVRHNIKIDRIKLSETIRDRQ